MDAMFPDDYHVIFERKMAISKSTNTYNRQNWEDSVSFKDSNVFYSRCASVRYV